MIAQERGQASGGGVSPGERRETLELASRQGDFDYTRMHTQVSVFVRACSSYIR